jgi:hypothetical protein
MKYCSLFLSLTLFGIPAIIDSCTRGRDPEYIAPNKEQGTSASSSLIRTEHAPQQLDSAFFNELLKSGRVRPIQQTEYVGSSYSLQDIRDDAEEIANRAQDILSEAEDIQCEDAIDAANNAISSSEACSSTSNYAQAEDYLDEANSEISEAESQLSDCQNRKADDSNEDDEDE